VSKERRIELGVVAVTALIVGTVVLVCEPFPPLLSACTSKGWTEAIEFVAINLVAWFVLSLLGVLPMKISIGTDGVAGERREIETEHDRAAEDILSVATKAITRVETLADICETLEQDQRALAARVDALHAAARDPAANRSGVNDD